MAVQALAIVVGRVELDLVRGRRRSEILNVNVAQATNLGAKAAIQGVVRVASVTGLIRGNSVVLEVGRRHILRIVDIKTLPVRLHDVARETKRCLLRPFDMSGGRAKRAEYGENEKRKEGEYFAASSGGQGRPNHDECDQSNGDKESSVQQGLRTRQIHDLPPQAVSPHNLRGGRYEDQAAEFVLLLAEFADVTDQLLDLVVRNFPFITRHGAFPGGNNLGQLGIGLLLHVRRMKIANLH